MPVKALRNFARPQGHNWAGICSRVLFGELLRVVAPALFISVTLVDCSSLSRRDVLARVLAVRGHVDWIDGASVSRPLTEKNRVGANSLLRASESSQVDLELLPGALLRVGGGSELKIDALAIVKDGNETDDAMRARLARLELNRGALIVAFEGVAQFAIATPQVRINVPPHSLFTVRIHTGKTRVTCIRGTIYVSTREREQSALEAGSFGDWSPIPATRKVSEDADAQRDAAEAEQAEQELHQLEAKHRNELPTKIDITRSPSTEKLRAAGPCAARDTYAKMIALHERCCTVKFGRRAMSILSDGL